MHETYGTSPEIRKVESLTDHEIRKIRAMQIFEQEFQPRTDLICYPFCGDDISPWKAFPGQDIVGIDNDSYSIKLLEEKGAGPAVYSDVEKIDLSGQVDVLLPFGFKLDRDTAAQLRSWVKPGGYILTDSLWNLGLFMGVYKQEMDLQGLVNRWYNVELVETDRETPKDLQYLRDLVDSQTTTGINAQIALESDPIKTANYGQSIFIIKVNDEEN